MITRRGFMIAAGGAAFAGPARSAEPGQPRRVGFLRHVPERLDYALALFRQELRDYGYVDGRDLVIEIRYTGGRDDLLQRYAAELVALPVDVLVTSGTAGATAAAKATQTIPIVAASVADPVALGIVKSLARPGGNVTGTSIISTVLAGKRLAVLREAVPGVKTVGVLINPGNASNEPQFAEAMKAGAALGLTVRPYRVRPPEGFERVFAAMAGDGVDAILILDDGELGAYGRSIADAALARRWPTAGGLRVFATDGVLIVYGADSGWHRAAYFVDRILKGAKPGDLPVEQMSKVEMIVNLKAAKALGLKLSPAFVARADEVIE